MAKKPEKNQKLFVVRKYIMAKSAPDAIKKESAHPPDDVWVDDEWKKGNARELASAIGFNIDDGEQSHLRTDWGSLDPEYVYSFITTVPTLKRGTRTDRLHARDGGETRRGT